MENNLFEGAKFGDKFLTRDGQVALYTGISDLWDKLTYTCYLEKDALSHYNSNGICIYPNQKIDIISRYKESINEEKLWELSEEYYKNNVEKPKIEKGITDEYFCPYLQPKDVEEAFYEGYLKAIQK